MFKLGMVKALLLIFVLGGCVSKPVVHTDYEPGYDFTKLKTFVVKVAKQDTRDNILASPFTLSHIHTSVNNELAKNFQSVNEESSADFVVVYHLVMEEKIDPRTYDDIYGFGFWGYRYPSAMFYHHQVDVYDQGSLIVDLIDAKSQKPIWRGVAKKRLGANLSPQRQRDILSAAVKEIFALFPPSFKS